MWRECRTVAVQRDDSAFAALEIPDNKAWPRVSRSSPPPPPPAVLSCRHIHAECTMRVKHIPPVEGDT